MRKIFITLVLLFVGYSQAALPVSAETEVERKLRLEAELQSVERQILTQSRLVEDKQVERQSLERDVAIIEGQIKQAQLGIQARSVAIMQLSDQISDKEITLTILEDKLKRQKESLSDLIRKSVLLDDFSLTEVRVLYELAHRDQPTATELARDLALDGGYLSRILRRFEGKGWLVRVPSPADARQSLLKLTDAGHNAFAPLQQKSRDEASRSAARHPHCHPA